MWENGIFISIPQILEYIVYYLLVPKNPTLYSELLKSAPSLFLDPAKALPLVGFAILERISSELYHLSWGIIAILRATTNKKWLWIIAFPMGLVDFLVPFEKNLGLSTFELIVFILALVSTLVASGLNKIIKNNLDS